MDEKLNELLISHEELMTVCKILMGIVLQNELAQVMEAELFEGAVKPGFATRAEEIQEKYTRERRMLMATGSIQ